MKLMVPGPAATWPEDLPKLAEPTLPHYGDAFLRIWHDVRDKLKTIFGTTGDVIMLPGCGTAGSEMALCGFARRKCLVVRSGAFADRLAEILTAHRAEVVDIEVPDRQAVAVAAVEAALAEHPEAAAVCVVHSETATGILHPVADIARAMRGGDALLVVDAVSSLGSLEFRMDEWGIDICFTGSQKALGCPPGLAMVAISDRAYAALTDNEANIVGWFLNPLTWKWYHENWQWHPYPTSLPTPVFVAMQSALNRLVGGGLDSHYARQKRAAAAIRRGCQTVGFELYAESERFASPSITALIPPKGLDEEAFRNSMLADHGIMIAGGFGKLRGKIIRIGHMGPGITDEYVRATLQAVKTCVREQGIECPEGAAVAAGSVIGDR